jgi:hypothetical protein
MDDGNGTATAAATQNALQIQGEANIASSSARVQAETQAAIMVAQRFRRSESQCRQDLLNSVKASPRLADKATYSYPRGKKQDPVSKEWVDNIISGPSTYIAREAARVWGNLVYGTEVVRDTDTERQIRSFAWDMQTNMRCVAEASFKKLVQRSKWVEKNGRREKLTEWVEPDERDLRELSNKYASIGERNCILKVVPSHLVDEVLEAAKQSTKEEAAKHPEAVRAKLADAFQAVGITVSMLEEYLRHPLKDTTPDKIGELRGIYTSIREGNSVWDDYRKSNLPTENEVPEMPLLRELAKKIGWNEAKLSSEIGRNLADIPKLIATMQGAGSSPLDTPKPPAEVLPPATSGARRPRETSPAQEF